MKILWITNTLFPAACEKLEIPTPVVGGWMYSSAEHLLNENEEIELGVASLYHGKELQSFLIDGITYYLIPEPSKRHVYETKLEGYWKSVKKEFSPEVVHIYGSEYPHGLAYVKACGNENVVLYIQGMVSVYERYYLGSIEEKVLRRNITLRDRVKNDSLFQQKKNMQKRAKYEEELIEKVNHVIGRTGWDKAHAWAINPQASYHHCDDTLRSVFYQNQWNYENCEKHSIFLSQGHYPIKGLHQMLKALPLILRDFPDAKVYVAGNDFFSAKKKWKLNGYGKYIRGLIKKYDLKEKVIFTGILSDREMCDRYLKCNVLVNPSSIENSPNAVGEAQMLGVPAVASYVGGVANLITNEVTGMVYRFEEYEMLAKAVVKLFSRVDLAKSISKNEKEFAVKKYSQKKNAETLYSIYRKVCKK